MIKLKKSVFALLVLATALAVAPAARADSFYFSFTDDGASGSGTLYGTNVGSGAWLLDSRSFGFFDDGTESGVINLVENPNGPGNISQSPSGTFGYDDLLFLYAGPNQYLTEAGLYFTFGDLELNLYQGGGGPGNDGWYEDNGNGDENGTFVITTYDLSSSDFPDAATPEPGSWLLLGTGLIGLAGFLLLKRGLPAPVWNA